MLFIDWTKQILAEELKKQLGIDGVIEAVRKASCEGKVAFYPCSRYTRMILKEIKKRDPKLLKAICGGFDLSPQATTEPDVRVDLLERLNDLEDEISLLVIASSTYYTRQEHDIRQHTNYSGPILKTSFFDYSMPQCSPEDILSEIDQINDLLCDTKSKMVYMVSWLSRVLNDENITSLFASENEIPEPQNNTLDYEDFTIWGVFDELTKEIFSDVYRMRHVSPAEGDVVLDVGAFRGETAIVFADLVGEMGKVYAFEPIKAAYDVMVQNIRGNRLEKIIKPVNMGCSSSLGTATAVSTESGAPWSYISDEDGSVKVRLTTIDEFISSNNIKKVDFIKIDVEGFESDVLLGAEKILKTHRPKLAVALYHRSSDMINIPRLVTELADYKLYVRCNMDGPYGLNLFCV